MDRLVSETVLRDELVERHTTRFAAPAGATPEQRNYIAEATVAMVGTRWVNDPWVPGSACYEDYRRAAQAWRAGNRREDT